MQQRYMPSRCHQVPRMPRETKVDVSKCHARHANSRPCHAKRHGVTAPPADQARHQSQPSAISATPATQSNNRCRQVTRLPHKAKVDITKCHACHAKRHGVTTPPADQARHQSQPSAISATPATQSNNRCRQVPCLPHKAKVDVTKCHACLAKRQGVTAPPADQARHQSQPSAISATPATQSNNRCRQVPRLPHKVKVDIAKCHACHAKRHGVTAPPADQARHQSQPSAISATPATLVCGQVVRGQVDKLL